MIETVISFVVGGGVSTLITTFIQWKWGRKTSQLDYTERISKFYDSENKNLIERIEKLESQIQELTDITCTIKLCRTRKKAI